MQNVSVIMPCFNHAQFLEDSINSIVRQSHADWELIIVDDCSGDNSWQIIGHFAKTNSKIKALRHARNQGLPKSRNDGLQLAKGEYIAFCDSDDVWECEKLETQLQLLRNNPGYDVTYCDTLIIDEAGVLTGQRFSGLHPHPGTPSGWLFRELVGGNFINVQSALMRRQCLASVDHFDEDLGVLEDWWYWVQMARDHRFLYSPQPLARYRVHNQSMSVMKRRSFPVTRVKIFRRMLRKYPDLPSRAKADIYYVMGVDLCALHKHRMGRCLLWQAARFAIADGRGLPRLCKAAARLAQSSAHSWTKIPKVAETCWDGITARRA